MYKDMYIQYSNKNMTDKNMANFLKIHQILAVIILATKVVKYENYMSTEVPPIIDIH